jgi:hypothetical protein
MPGSSVGQTGIIQIFVLLLAFPASQMPGLTQARCSITIVPPRGWTVGKSETSPDGQCVFGVSPQKDWSRIRRENADVDPGPYPITITVFTGRLETLVEKQELGKDARGWYFPGRAGVTNRASELKTRCCLAVRGRSETGRYGKSGYAGMGQVEIAIVVDKNTIAWIQSDSSLALLEDGLETFDKLMMSLRFR